MSNTSSFLNAISNAGLNPPAHIEPGRIYRFPGLGKTRTNRAGWCQLSESGLFGSFGDWSSDFKETWRAHLQPRLSSRQQKKLMERVHEERLAALEGKRRLQHRAALLARDIWNAATAGPFSFRYLITKGIRQHNSRMYRGILVLPIIDLSGSFASLQFISADGSKRLLARGRKGGCYIPIAGCPDKTSTIVICEGWATGCTLAEHTPNMTIIAAIDAGNLTPVDLGIRELYPEISIIIAGDDDRLTAGNPGATKARAAAIASGALLALPKWPKNAPESLTDFNDLALFEAGAGL